MRTYIHACRAVNSCWFETGWGAHRAAVADTLLQAAGQTWASGAPCRLGPILKGAGGQGGPWLGGKALLLINESAGSFLLGEFHRPAAARGCPGEKELCGKWACINIRPTGAIIAPYVVTDGAASPISP